MNEKTNILNFKNEKKKFDKFRDQKIVFIIYLIIIAYKMSHKDYIGTYAILYGYYEGYIFESKYHKMLFTTSNVRLNILKYIYPQ